MGDSSSMDLCSKFNLCSSLSQILRQMARIKLLFHSKACCLRPRIIWSYLLSALTVAYWNLTSLMKKINRLREKQPRGKRIQILAQSMGVDADILASEINQFPEINASKIVSLNSRINGGKYQPNSGSVSDKLISLELQLKWNSDEKFNGFMHMLF